MYHTFTKNLALILPATALIACGGGSGSSNSDDNTGDSAPDNTTPATLYSVGGTVTGAVNQGLILENSGGDTLEVTDENFAFSTKLTNGTSYDVAITAHPAEQLCSATNTTGTISDADVNNVEVHCRKWGTPTLAENSSGHAMYIAEAVADSEGNILAPFTLDQSGYRNLYVNRFDASTGTWGTETSVENQTGGHALDPAIAVHDNGDAIVVWSQFDGSLYNIFANYYTASTDSWGTEELIETTSTGHAFGPQIAIDNSGNAIAVWRHEDGSYYSTYANYYTASTQTWGTEEVIESANDGNAESQKIAIDSSGHAIAVWSQANSAYNDILVNEYTPGSGWGTAATIAVGNNGNGGARDPQLAFDSNDNAIVAWREWDGTNTSIYAIRYNASTDSWGTEVLLENGNDGNADNQKLAFDNDNNAIVVWLQSGPSVQKSVYANRYTASTDSWGTETLIESNQESSASVPKIVVNAEGNALVVWNQDNSTNDNLLYFNRYIASSNSWQTEALVEDSLDESDKHQLVMDSSGNATLVDARNDGTYLSVNAIRFK